MTEYSQILDYVTRAGHAMGYYKGGCKNEFYRDLFNGAAAAIKHWLATHPKDLAELLRHADDLSNRMAIRCGAAYGWFDENGRVKPIGTLAPETAAEARDRHTIAWLTDFSRSCSLKNTVELLLPLV